MIGLQKAVAEDGLAYSPELSEELLLAAGGDIDMYRKDRQSDFVKESFQTDQKVAREMGLNNTYRSRLQLYLRERFRHFSRKF